MDNILKAATGTFSDDEVVQLASWMHLIGGFLLACFLAAQTDEVWEVGPFAIPKPF